MLQVRRGSASRVRLRRDSFAASDDGKGREVLRSHQETTVLWESTSAALVSSTKRAGRPRAEGAGRCSVEGREVSGADCSPTDVGRSFLRVCVHVRSFFPRGKGAEIVFFGSSALGMADSRRLRDLEQWPVGVLVCQRGFSHDFQALSDCTRIFPDLHLKSKAKAEVRSKACEHRQLM